MAQRQHICFSPNSPRFDSQHSQKFSEEKLSMLLRLINGAGQGKVDSGFNMLIEFILFWLVASQYCKKTQKNHSRNLKTSTIRISLLGHNQWLIKICLKKQVKIYSLIKIKSCNYISYFYIGINSYGYGNEKGSQSP